MSDDSDKQLHELNYVPNVPKATTVCGSGEFLAVCLTATVIAFISRAGGASSSDQVPSQFYSCFGSFVLAFLIAPFSLPKRRAIAWPIAILVGAVSWLPGAMLDG